MKLVTPTLHIEDKSNHHANIGDNVQLVHFSNYDWCGCASVNASYIIIMALNGRDHQPCNDHPYKELHSVDAVHPSP